MKRTQRRGKLQAEEMVRKSPRPLVDALYYKRPCGNTNTLLILSAGVLCMRARPSASTVFYYAGLVLLLAQRSPHSHVSVTGIIIQEADQLGLFNSFC
jgi:hypothetical protein